MSKGPGVRRLVAFFAGSLPVLLVNLLSRWFLAVKGFDSVYLKGCAWCGVISTALQSTKGRIVWLSYRERLFVLPFRIFHTTNRVAFTVLRHPWSFLSRFFFSPSSPIYPPAFLAAGLRTKRKKRMDTKKKKSAWRRSEIRRSVTLRLSTRSTRIISRTLPSLFFCSCVSPCPLSPRVKAAGSGKVKS